ncbi:vancomycin high temperature exclusion protein [Oerskovia jenensis]|uniref:Vancomycin permeability regulator SanA n=1 Tax=Oerskovia jenensis TaxID=162169 RepID=A0ABS2LCU5_9CELL|nr:ElyC/SanA/YdcF family protein [Oerskovia jenensis]MBM7478251.1 vancomycin permeability regulator SanA [Oerskovia jenensis]
MSEQGTDRATPRETTTGTTRRPGTATESPAGPDGDHRPVPSWLRGRRGRAVVVGAAVLALALAAPVTWVQVSGRLRVQPGVEDVPARPVALVLGAGLRPDGTPSTYLTRRLDAARELYERGTVEVILVSGDNSREDYDEPTAMLDWLVGHGVPADRVVRDFAGFDTHDTCVRAREVFGVTEAVVLTQDYHLPRALFSCAQAGIDAVGVGVSAESVEPAKAVVYRVREVPASLKAAWDAVTGREPVHLGARETGVTDVLDSLSAATAAAASS